MKVYKTKDFSRLFKSEAISDSQLCEAVMRAEKGIIDADLGKGLIKQRIPRENAGRSGGYRSLMAYKHGNITLFLYLFAKNEKENIYLKH